MVRKTKWKHRSHLCEGDEGEHSHRREHDGGNQHEYSCDDVGAEKGDGSQPAAEEDNTVVTRGVYW